MGRSDRIYSRLPVWGQHAAVTAYGAYWKWMRFGGAASSMSAAYTARDEWSSQQWARWQHDALRSLLSEASTSVPYYRESWSAAEKRGAAAGDLSALPILTKEPLRASPRRFVSEALHPRFPLVFHTSGSTGTPIATMWTIDEYRDAMAIREARSAGWAGVSFRLPRATFSGRMVVPDPNSSGPFHRYNAIERQVYLSPFHLRREHARAYVEALRQHDVRWLTGYAVSYFLLARFIIEEKLRVPPLLAVITTSEKVTPEMRTTMETAYGCRVYEEYSTVENALFASECADGKLHLSPDWGIVEILRPDGSPAAPGEEGHVVATCLRRRYQPMIRFQLGDAAVWDSTTCVCGRQMPVLREVTGRIEDVIVGPDGRQLVRFHGIFTNQPHVREAQVIQLALDRLTIKVVPTEAFGDDDRRDIETRIQQRLGNVQVTVELVDSIPRTKAGKFQAVISRLPT